MEFPALKIKSYSFNTDFFFERSGDTYNFDKKKFGPCILCADPSLNTGLALFSKDGELISAFHAVEVLGQNNIEYRRDLYKFIVKIHNKFNISHIYVEDVFLGKSIDTFKVLLSLQQTYLEIENDYPINVIRVNNTRWKSGLGKKMLEDDKENITYWVSKQYNVEGMPQDIIDAIGIGISVLKRNSMVATLPPRSAFTYKLYLVKEPSEVAQIFLSKHRKAYETYGFNYFTYNNSELFKANALHALVYDPFVFTLITDHRYFSQILLQNGLRKKDTEGKYLLAVLQRRVK